MLILELSEGCRIPFGRDFIGDTFDQTGIPVEDPDPYAGCTGGGHGSHVIGTIGMVDPETSPWGLIGVAPEPTLGMYRVFGCPGGAPDDVLLLAFQQAAIDKADILSCSFGSNLQWEEEDPFAVITSNLEKMGIVVALMTPAPAVGKGVVAVGSAQNSHYPAVYGFKDSRGRSMKYGGGPWPVNAPATGLVVYDLRKIAASTSAPNELGCDLETWDAAAKLVQDKSNSIIAVPYGGICSWGWKITIAQVSGFRYSLVYSLQDGDVFDQEYNSLDPLPPYYGITINAVDGRALTGGLPNSKEGEYKLFFTSKEFESHPQFAPGARSNFSSWGPTSDTLDIKPQISAPGGSILSTWPLSGTGYAILSSTSIAAPYASGAFALLKSQFPTATVQQLQEKLQSTAKNILYAYDKDLRSSIAQQAGGLINVQSGQVEERHF
ncbi:hypothetical protein ACEPPN_003834 [Leptodophora sp. 'Broadleaf-Isolate-01']